METEKDIEIAIMELLGAAARRHALEDARAFMGTPYLPIAHDNRGAPYLQLDDGSENHNLLVSRTDEDKTVITAWVKPATGSSVKGFGIDLVTLSDFEGECGAFLIHHLLSEQDLRIVPELSPTPEVANAFAFSAKEAAFKACSQPLRAHVDAGGEDLCFEARGFELASMDEERGTARKGEAQTAMDALGIARIELMRASAGDLAVTLAFALSR